MDFEELNKQFCKRFYIPRRSDGHKGVFGKVLIMAGSEVYPGAGIMAANGALGSGVGIVTLALPETLKGSLPFYISPEIILRYFPAKDGGFYLSRQQAVGLCNGYDAVLVGCGWGKNNSRLECLKNISEACENSLVLDADALNMIAEKKAYEILDMCKAKTIITPHIAEFTRLMLYSSLDLKLENRIELSNKFAKKHNTIIVQKSASTVISDSIKNIVLNKPNSGLAKGGSGDLLAGLIAGLIASKQCREIIGAVALGVYLHSLAGEIAKNNYSENAMTIDNVANSISKAWLEFLKE